MRPLLAALIAALLIPAAAHAQTLERIKQNGQLVIGFRTDAAPLSYLGENEPKGYTPTVCYALASKIAAEVEVPDLEIIFRSVTAEDRFEQVANGNIDLLCGAATITLERRELVDFSVPIYVDGTVVVLKKGGPDSLEGLAGMKVGVRAATTTLEALQNSLAAADIAAEVVIFDDHPTGMAALEQDEIAAYFADQSILMNMVMQSEVANELKVFDQLLTVEKQGLAMARGDTEFRLVVDRGLSELFTEGTMEQAFARALPNVKPGLGLQAMYLLSPTLP
ncbi:amino acid ABC transporter substrate-binding protein [Roseobacter denitrificans]|uniref:Amino-acid ABC transporter, periplasmic binding protein n=1 Tax=Roseobacter denitrificans (strain ATCC 33942 / OCh 114) TaxID=375451 RepID=Q16AY4_ROSDO|nr:amino acid ABC transporter substrate-binding protein [Roseobacter denitrificans]ABG30859.1 amino-acid ABC transporter, periplasmic binding protein [Roseobacter denitrificans OCh 114]AVL53961.1 amino acid ABC transporter substrate-binding protein [Roseobacter denitrificans]SFG15084.1 amino acid ABC transporter substrate-binding protein, PAAT family [Roseobacter denitrificans OCh 114]